MGRSARVPFKVHAKREDIDGRVNEAESFFLDALEEWRQKMGIEKMSLIGHSLGAYLSTAYALRYPDRVNQLILLSPAGVPRDPNNTEEPSRELDPAPSHAGSATGTAVPATEARVAALKAEQRAAKREESTFRKVATYLWEEGWSPFQIVRSAMFYGPWLVGKYSGRRFDLTDEDKRDMHDYIWHITRAKGSGEYCISHLLAPGAHARRPLVDRVKDIKVPITFVYGDHDWMDPKGGRASLEALKRAGNFGSRMYMIQNAGHHATKRAVFQSVASMGLPALTIHTVVKQATKAFVNVKNVRLKAWGPTFTGLGIVPFLPYIFDHPVEHATDRIFSWVSEQMIKENARKAKKEL
ncbi:hypothetical protein FRC08_003736 [Ceratobasidium sp. 394]|nr:hypothetical protein FRC08_003736 [Ceratobasidium sp. 394]